MPINSIKILVILILSVFVLTGTGCHILKRDKQSIAEKKQEAADKKVMAEYNKGRKGHYRNQSKESKYMMKQSKKRAAKLNKSKKRGLFTSNNCD